MLKITIVVIMLLTVNIIDANQTKLTSINLLGRGSLFNIYIFKFLSV